jgi:hypothetical protein
MSRVGAGSGPRQVARRRTEEILRRPGILATPAAVLTAIVLVIVGCAKLSDLIGHPWSPEVVAFVLGAAVATVVCVFTAVILVLDGSWSWRVGALGERSTAEVLHSLPGDWVIEHNIPYWYPDGRGEWDIDHVVIGPAGVVVVDTKWISDPWAADDLRTTARTRSQVATVRDHAEQIAKEICNTVGPVTTTPALVFWGPRVARSGSVAVQHGGVAVVAGPDLASWLLQLPTHPLPAGSNEVAAAVLRRRINDHERWQAKRKVASSTDSRWKNR